jgi:hypothetical protein
MNSFTQCGRIFTEVELSHIKKIVTRYSKLSLAELAETICEHLSWQTVSGGNKRTACLKLLEKLQANGVVSVKNKKVIRKPKDMAVAITNRTNPTEIIQCSLKELGHIDLEIAHKLQDKKLWNEYVERFHYLKYKRPFGNVLRYFIRADKHLLGCLLVAGAARSIVPRDNWIGWSREQRNNNLPYIVNNTRFLIFPWVKIPHLASHALGKLIKRVGEDYEEYHNFRPILMETFVDPNRYTGICYKASNWIYLGLTQGIDLKKVGRSDKEKSKKMVFVYPLIKNAKKILRQK